MEEFAVTDNNFKITGRTLRIGDFLWLGWVGSGLEFSTGASKVTAEIMGITQSGAPSDYGYLGIVIDDDYEHMRKLRIARGRTTYDILENFGLRSRRVRIIKLSETRNDEVGIGKFYADEPFLPARPCPHRILFVGDSLTAGYGVDCDIPAAYDGMTTKWENVTRAYSFLTAQALNADAQYLAWSGNGVISQYIDMQSDLPETDDLIPEMYPYVDRRMEEVVKIYLSAHGHRLNARKLTVFDPDSFVPDVIVCYLGTNDASFTRGMPVREQHFTRRYAELLQALGMDYPRAYRLVVYGTMEGSLSTACFQAARLSNSDYLQLPLMNPADGIGGAGHPSALTQRKIGHAVTERIQMRMGW